jgi:predicted phosphodiesterase
VAARRIAVLSDIHGNLPALEAVLDDAAAQGATTLVNLGDIASGPLWPAETVDRLMPLAMPTIRGNHERQLLAPRAEQGDSDRFAVERLRADQLAWMAALPASLRLEGLLLVHGSPTSDVDTLLETVTPAGIGPADAAAVTARLGAVPERGVLCGHSHLQRHLDLGDGRMVVNPGSVGLPAYAHDQPYPHRVESGSPHARYAVLSDDRAGGWSVELRQVDYDWAAAARRADAAGRPDWARALRTGRA